jgi:hypothetical protein
MTIAVSTGVGCIIATTVSGRMGPFGPKNQDQERYVELIIVVVMTRNIT